MSKERHGRSREFRLLTTVESTFNSYYVQCNVLCTMFAISIFLPIGRVSHTTIELIGHCPYPARSLAPTWTLRRVTESALLF